MFGNPHSVTFCSIDHAPDGTLLPCSLKCPSGSIFRYRVALVIPSSAQRSLKTVSFASLPLGQSRTCAFVRANFLPPLLPRAQAAAKPAFVRSRINSRSNSARAAKMSRYWSMKLNAKVGICFCRQKILAHAKIVLVKLIAI